MAPSEELAILHRRQWERERDTFGFLEHRLFVFSLLSFARPWSQLVCVAAEEDVGVEGSVDNISTTSRPQLDNSLTKAWRQLDDSLATAWQQHGTNSTLRFAVAYSATFCKVFFFSCLKRTVAVAWMIYMKRYHFWCSIGICIFQRSELGAAV